MFLKLHETSERHGGCSQRVQHTAGWVTALLVGSHLKVVLACPGSHSSFGGAHCLHTCSSGTVLTSFRAPMWERGLKAEPVPGFISNPEPPGDT